MDSLLKYKVYFENIARTLNSVSHTDDDPHFESIHSSALLSGVQSTIKDVAFFLESYTAGFSDNAGTLVKRPNGGFSIVMQVDLSGSYTEKTNAIIWAEQECMKVLAKIMQDKKNAVAEVRGFDFNTVNFMPLDNMPAGWCGMRVEFEMAANTILCFDENEWQSDAALVMPCKPLSEYSAAELLAVLSEAQLNGILAEQNVLLLEDGNLIEIE